MLQNNGALTDSQWEQFLNDGYIVIRGAFSREDSIKWVEEECKLAGYDLDDPSTWSKPYDRITTQHANPLGSFSPQGWELSKVLMGGTDRVKAEPKINLFALNLSQGADRPFEQPTSSSPGWHKDGWHFRHFLDSPDQGLLGIPLLTDVYPQGGATFIAAGSVKAVARFLANHPEGVHPNDFPWKEMLDEGCTFLEATGEAGDFYLLHPYLLHAVSQNVLRRPRAISNILYELKEPLNFNREDEDYSPVEAAVLHGLEVDRFDFQPTRERLMNPSYGPMGR